MPWTEITREQYRRDELRYASDMTDAEWRLIERLLPRAHRRGRPRRTDLRSVVEAMLYILSTGCQWRALPQEFPALFDSAGLFLCVAGYGTVAKDRQRSCLAGAKKARTRAKTDSRRDRQPKCADHAGRGAARLRRGETHLRPQAAYCDRYQWPASRGSCSSGQRPGLPWRGTAAEEGTDAIPSAGPRLCRPDLSGEATSRCALGLRSMDHRDRRAAPRRQRLPASAATMGC